MTAFTQPTPEDMTVQEHTMSSLLLGYARLAADTPRSRQTTIGLSEYGHPCHRQLAMKIAGVPPVQGGGDQWASTLGTWSHAGLTETIRTAPDAADWLLDHKVMVGGMIPGTLDAFHIPTGTVVDFKFSGPDTITKYRRHGPPANYIAQGHGYGMGLADEGYAVRQVAIAFYPRAATLKDFWLWTASYNPAIPTELLQRMQTIYDLIDALDLWDGRNPDRWARFEAIPDRCYWCPFYKAHSTTLIAGCPGKAEVAA